MEEMFVFGGLVDIIIDFTYEQLTTQGDSGVESTCTVSIVSPTLSWMDSNADLHAVVRSAYVVQPPFRLCGSTTWPCAQFVKREKC